MSDIVTTDRRLWLTADGTKLVEDGDPAAAILWSSGSGQEVLAVDAARLNYEPLPVEPDADTETDPNADPDPDPDPDPETKAKQPARNKAKQPARNKAGGADLEVPPRGGTGSDTEAWVEFAAAATATPLEEWRELADADGRDAVIARLEADDVISGE